MKVCSRPNWRRSWRCHSSNSISSGLRSRDNFALFAESVGFVFWRSSFAKATEPSTRAMSNLHERIHPKGSPPPWTQLYTVHGKYSQGNRIFSDLRQRGTAGSPGRGPDAPKLKAQPQLHSQRGRNVANWQSTHLCPQAKESCVNLFFANVFSQLAK